jgi:hypothetical protein
MRRYTLIFGIFLILGLLVGTVAAEKECFEATLVAGQHYPVGTVTACIDDSSLTVTYDAPGYELEETHLAVGYKDNGDCIWFDKFGEQMVIEKNPAPGQFPYSSYDEGSSWEQVIDLTSTPIGDISGECLCIAAHSVVSGGGCYCMDVTLPETVDVTNVVGADITLFNSPPPIPMFIATLDVPENGYSIEDGDYPGWCVSSDITPYPSGTSCTILSSLDDLDPPFDGVDWARVNWILNHYDEYPGITGGDVDRALLAFININTSFMNDPVDPITLPANAKMLYDAAMSADGFDLENCESGDVMAAIIYCDCDPECQVIIIEVPVPYECMPELDETAWAGYWDDGMEKLTGIRFTERGNWATYFTSCIGNSDGVSTSTEDSVDEEQGDTQKVSNGKAVGITKGKGKAKGHAK